MGDTCYDIDPVRKAEIQKWFAKKYGEECEPTKPDEDNEFKIACPGERKITVGLCIPRQKKAGGGWEDAWWKTVGMGHAWPQPILEGTPSAEMRGFLPGVFQTPARVNLPQSGAEYPPYGEPMDADATDEREKPTKEDRWLTYPEIRQWLINVRMNEDAASLDVAKDVRERVKCVVAEPDCILQFKKMPVSGEEHYDQWVNSGGEGQVAGGVAGGAVITPAVCVYYKGTCLEPAPPPVLPILPPVPDPAVPVPKGWSTDWMEFRACPPFRRGYRRCRERGKPLPPDHDEPRSRTPTGGEDEGDFGPPPEPPEVLPILPPESDETDRGWLSWPDDE